MKFVVAVVLFAMVATMPGHVAAQEGQLLAVAAAADMRFALDELVEEFAQRSGAQARVTYGSSVQLATQISQGAPFDIFFSADEHSIRQLLAHGLVLSNTVHLYAIGRIVLWVRKDSSIDLRQGLRVLTDKRIRFVAIANPGHAPYGRAAVQALRAAGIWDPVRPKLVLGENISQAFQFVRTGNADAGIVALSLAVGDAGQQTGRYWLIPPNLYHPIHQTAAVMAQSPHRGTAKVFLAFVTGREGRNVLRRYGFGLPGQAP